MSFLNDIQKDQLQEFAKFVQKQLEIEIMPTISIQNGRGKLKTTANYDHTKPNKIIRINAHKRALVDVMRSLAHELVHHKQWEKGELKVQPPDIGGPIEDEANAKAGQYIKMFSKIDPDIYNIE
jgi:hypothetical protein